MTNTILTNAEIEAIISLENNSVKNHQNYNPTFLNSMKEIEEEEDFGIDVLFDDVSETHNSISDLHIKKIA